MATHLPCQDAWTRARNRYMEDLTHEEKQLYMRATPEMIFYDASAAEKSHEANSTSRGLMHKLQPFVAAIEQYGQALDVYSNAYPLALSPLWGSIRILLMIAREFGKYFEKIVDMFARIGDVLPQFQVYERLFPNHERLIHALSIAYVDIIVFCSDAKAVFRRGQRASLTSLKVGFKLLWKPFESQFGQQLDNFRTHRKNVEKEAGLSHMVEAADARALTLANHLQLEKTKKENEYQKVMAMIESVDVEAKQRKLHNLRYDGTGDWVLLNDRYLEWKHASGTSSLCCYGIPGSGKSMLASRIIDDLLDTTTSSNVRVVYYFCDFADQRTLQTDRILGTVLKQLLPEGRFPEEIEPQILQAYRHSQRTPGTHKIADLVVSLMQLHPVTYIVIDGLDECERQARREVLDMLNRISALETSSVHTFVSCRDEDELLRALQLYPRIQLTTEALDVDIKSFVKGSVRSRIGSGQMKIQNPELEEHIVEELVRKAHGMFLWVVFQLDELCEAISDAMVRQTLRDLPLGLVQTYERILLKISKVPLRRQEIALRAFKWMVCSRRPMSAEELQEAVAFDNSDHCWDRDKIPDKDLMIETCRGLLVREEDGTVRFAHYTVQQYLLSAPTIGGRFQVSTRSEAEAYSGEVCVTYLSFSDFETQIALRTPDAQLEHIGVLKAGGPVSLPTVLGIRKWLLDIPYRFLGGKPIIAPLDIDYSKYLTPYRTRRSQVPTTLTERYRLLGYVVGCWMDHTQALEHALNVKLRHLVMHRTLSFEFKPWGSNQHFGHYGCGSCPDPTKAKELPFMSLFHYAAHAGHWSLMENLVVEYCQHESPVDETLLIACRQGQDNIVRNLMNKIKFDISDGRAINVAVTAGQAHVLKYFMDHEMKYYNVPSYSAYIAQNTSSLLRLAAANGHENVVDTILRHYSTPNSNDGNNYNSGYEKTSYVNMVDEHTGRTALFSATMNGHKNVVRKLLENGAEIRANGTTAFHIAAEYGHQDILQILLEAASETANYRIPRRRIGMESGGETSDSTLLQYYDTEGYVPLHKAVRNGHSAAVKLILKHRPTTVHIDTKGELKYNGKSIGGGLRAVHLAAIGGHLGVLKILANNKADLTATTKGLEWSALQFAAAEGHEVVVEWLLRNFCFVAASMNKDTETYDLYYELIEVVGFIESAAVDGMEAVLTTLLPCVGLLGEVYLEKAKQVAKLGGYHRALALLEPLLEERLWERDPDTRGWCTTFRKLQEVEEVGEFREQERLLEAYTGRIPSR